MNGFNSKESVEIEVNGKKYSFKKQTGWDYINAANPAIRDVLKMQVRLAAQGSQNPKLSEKDILNMPLGEYQDFIAAYLKASGLEKREKLSDFLG